MLPRLLYRAYDFLARLIELVRKPMPEETYCDGCKKFSRGNVCPYCK